MSPAALLLAAVVAALTCACAATPPPSPTPPAAATRPSAQTVLDATAIGTLVGAPATQQGPGAKVAVARTDVAVEVDGWAMPPFMGLTSWVTFTPGEKPGVEAMLMGDLVLFEDEVSPVMSALLDGGAEVTALHNHFFYDKPKVFFMHVGGEGTVDALAKATRSALAAQKAVRAKAARPAEGFGGAPLPAASTIDAGALDAALGVKGTAKDGMYKAVMGRRATASCGCAVGPSQGVSTWAAFAGGADNALVDGDFAVTEAELQRVLKSLRASGVHVVAIHHHMTGESPRILFLHYWGRGRAADLAAAVKRALDLTAWDKG